jgi:tripartite-type tricarboxylate transporter receptor subunit TctC
MIGIFTRAGTPKPFRERVVAEAMAIAGDAEFVGRLSDIGVVAAGAGPEDFGRAIKSEGNRVIVAIRAAGLKPQ